MSVAYYTPSRPAESRGLYDIIDLILDKGLVIDAFVRVSVLGLELLTIDARIVVASVDTYLRFAEATGRLRLDRQAQGKQPMTLPDVLGKGVPEVVGKGLKGAAGGVLSEAKETVQQVLGAGEDSGGHESSAERRQDGEDQQAAGSVAESGQQGNTNAAPPRASAAQQPGHAGREAPPERRPPSRGTA